MCIRDRPQTAAHASAAMHPQHAATSRARSACAAPCCSAAKAKIHCDGGTRKVSSSRRIERARERGADGARTARDEALFHSRRRGCRKILARFADEQRALSNSTLTMTSSSGAQSPGCQKFSDTGAFACAEVWAKGRLTVHEKRTHARRTRPPEHRPCRSQRNEQHAVRAMWRGASKGRLLHSREKW